MPNCIDLVYRTEFEGVKNPVLAAVVQFFTDFLQGPPRTIWQGPRRPLHK